MGCQKKEIGSLLLETEAAVQKSIFLQNLFGLHHIKKMVRQKTFIFITSCSSFIYFAHWRRLGLTCCVHVNSVEDSIVKL